MGNRGQVRVSQLIDKFQLQERRLSGWDLEKSVQHLDKLITDIDFLQCLSLQILQNDIRLFVKENAVHRVWKITVYKYVHYIRELLRSQGRKEKAELSAFLECIINLAQVYFQKLLTAIEEVCAITHDEFTGSGVFTWKDEKKRSYSKYAKESYVKILVLIGDTCRYSFINHQKLKEAMENYELARSLAPTKGRAYHQIGVVAPHQYYLSKLYNLMRAYTAFEPQDEVRPELFIIFDEAYKEYKRIESDCWYAKAKTNEAFPNTYIRKEVWVYTVANEKVPAIAEDPHTKEMHFRNMPQFEIYRRFSLTFIQFIGKLFTGIGLDSIDIVAEEALVYFEGLLKKANGNEFMPPIFVIQLLALNMFLIDHVRGEVTRKPNSEYLESTVINFVMELFSLFCEKLTSIIYCGDWEHTLLEPLSVGMQIFCDWLDLNQELVSKRRPRAVFSVRHVISTKYDNKKDNKDDVWIHFANLMSRLEIAILRLGAFLFPSVSEERSPMYCIPLCPLLECLHLASFRTFAGANIMYKKYYAVDSHSKKRARIFLRLKNVYEYGCKVFLGGDNVLQREGSFYKCHIYKSLVRTIKPKDSEICGIDSKSYHFYTAANNPPIVPMSRGKRRAHVIRRPDCNNCRIIIRKKDQDNKESSKLSLPTWKGMREYEEWLYFSNRNYLMEILVDPKRFVIDTNCFINKFSLIEILVHLVPRPIYVPVSELRGLSRGGLTAKDLARFGSAETQEAQEKILRNKDVAEKCVCALNFVENHMAYFYIVTSTGRTVPAKSPWDMIKDDYFDPNRSNDDRIVDVCKYLESRDVDARSKDCQRRIYRKTVLITGDRNLRIRISSMDIPTRPLISIILWLNWKLYPETYNQYLKWSKNQARAKRLARAALRKETGSPTQQKNS